MTDVVNKYHGTSEKSDEGKMSYYCGLQLADRSLYILGVIKMKEKIKHMRGFYGIRISPTVCILPKCHPCYGCVWNVKDTNVLFCPFQSCVKNKKGFKISESRNDKNGD